jgi:hypothetical protein
MAALLAALALLAAGAAAQQNAISDSYWISGLCPTALPDRITVSFSTSVDCLAAVAACSSDFSAPYASLNVTCDSDAVIPAGSPYVARASGFLGQDCLGPVTVDIYKEDVCFSDNSLFSYKYRCVGSTVVYTRYANDDLDCSDSEGATIQNFLDSTCPPGNVYRFVCNDGALPRTVPLAGSAPASSPARRAAPAAALVAALALLGALLL